MIAGIWDCLSSQDVVNFVRYQVSQGKELTEIGEMICDHCLAPDTSSENDIGCDNMSVLIVAITHGRSKKKWYAWIKDRVKKNYGYETPSTLRQIYSQSRLMAFRAKKESYDKHQRALEEKKSSAQPNASTSAQSAPTMNLEERRLTQYKKGISEEHNSSLEHAGTDGDMQSENSSLSLLICCYSSPSFPPFRTKTTIKATRRPHDDRSSILLSFERNLLSLEA